MTITNNVKYCICPNKVSNKVKRMHKKFVSEYVNKDYMREFQRPTTFVSYYNLNELKHDIKYTGWSIYDPSLSSPHTLIFNAIYCDSWNDDYYHEGQSIDVNTILHEFAHYINKCDYLVLRGIIERYNGDIDVDAILSEKQLRYTKRYNAWDYILKQEYNEFLTAFYKDNNKRIGATYNEFYRMCNASYEHLSFDFYRACYLCWRLYYESKNRRANYPMFVFKDILGYDGHDNQLLQLTVDASR